MITSPRMVGRNPSSLIESQALQKKNYTRYNHTDACRLSRWNTKECYQFMSAKPWQKVNEFYSNMVKGRISLSEVFGKEAYAINDGAVVKDCDNSQLASVSAEDKNGRWARATFKIILSYHGGSFDGWQKQPGLNNVQGWIEKSLGKFVDDKKAQLLKEKNLPIEGCALVAGRTDKGIDMDVIHLIVCTDTWRKDIETQDIEESINVAAPGKIRAVSVSKVSREFHPNFSAKWRRYLYILPFNDDSERDHTGLLKNMVNNAGQDGHGDQCTDEASNGHAVDVGDHDEDGTGNKPTSFLISSVNHLLHQLEGKLLSYRMFARDTKPSRNIGPPTECFVFHARAAEVLLPCAEDGTYMKSMCIELVANRFLRKMVRVLVATAVREAAAGAGEDALLKLMDATCRRATAPPAPPDGLCLVNVGYTEFDKKSCLIP